jgi:F0F1-type ATP synthase membrane subunit b/b'
MTINFTLVVQIINFFIAYFIISKILLKPAIAIIQDDSKVEKEFLNLIKSRELKIQDKESYKQKLWDKSLNQFQKEKPSLIKDKTKLSWKTPVAKEISNDLKNNLQNNITDLIINKVKHVEQ